MQTKTKKEKKNRENKQNHSVFLLLVVLAFVGVIVVSSVINYAQAKENNREAAAVYAQCEEMSEENQELEHFLKEENHDEYYEKIAREDYGYAKPGERVVYDSSFGN